LSIALLIVYIKIAFLITEEFFPDVE